MAPATLSVFFGTRWPRLTLALELAAFGWYGTHFGNMFGIWVAQKLRPWLGNIISGFKLAQNNDYSLTPVQAQLVVFIQRRPTWGQAYFDLANTLFSTVKKDVTLESGEKLTQQELFIRAIENNPYLDAAYTNLALVLEPGTTVTIANEPMTRRDLRLAAVRLHFSSAINFNNLGMDLAVDECVALPDGTTADKRQCFLKAIERDPYSQPMFYHNLATTLARDEEIVSLPEAAPQPDGRMNLTKRELGAVTLDGLRAGLA
mmetsp:Transcript_104692/g.207999  ORF Transcript_104692/g.207999 Transcript_104692/m.207999 type:complete len:260 (+) Transcript_104692:76-855(+)|eukprot:CAMPEP_0172668276 /NCGR_PEP_ID=MMETSP1074-20121228/8963_1 /TAXON_ID=2916 /ORGANISM="Ceratium fusus, Strain PA161109" /LENGTH=259 /DNA_ID=CAMNT_0013484911 /DNA_START=64 /DNA_END=843 /DNA_ORIENTATION=-